jgi:hypothetical protein
MGVLAIHSNPGLAQNSPTKARAIAPLRAPEAAVEVQLHAVVVPDTLGLSFLVTPCPGCAPLSLRSGAEVQIRWNGQVLSFAELRLRALAQRRAVATLIYRRENRALLKINISG